MVNQEKRSFCRLLDHGVSLIRAVNNTIRNYSPVKLIDFCVLSMLHLRRGCPLALWWWRI